MPRFHVSASVTADVLMEIEANTADEAKQLFDDNIILTASLVDVPAWRFIVLEDAISEVDGVEVEGAE